MKTHPNRLGFSVVARFWSYLSTLFCPVDLTRGLVPIPVATSRRPPSPPCRRIPSGWRTGGLILLVGTLSLILPVAPARAAQPTLPSGVPNIFDPEVREHFEFLGVTNLRGNPDFPMVLLINTGEDKPEALLLGMDARNGGETWSLESDPIILIVTFTDPTTIQELYVDTGFAGQGKASGNYAVVDNQNSLALPDLLKAVSDTSKRTSI